MQIRGPFKLQTLQILKDRGVPISTILDVGVLDGTPELIASFPDIKHMLFEPVVEFSDRIEQHYKNVPHELHQVAVGAETGLVTLRTSAKIEGVDISHSAMEFGASAGAENTRTVPMFRLDDILSRLGTSGPYLLKIDIDGHELKVIQGAVETLKSTSVLILECAHNNLVERLRVVENAGFRLFDLCEPCYYDKVFWQCDAVFLRQDIFLRHFQDLVGGVQPGMYETFR